MAYSKNSLNKQELTTKVNTLKLRLEKNSKDLVSKKPQKNCFNEESKKIIACMFRNVEHEIKPIATNEITENNKAKITQIFENMKNRIDAQKLVVMREMQYMSLQQQNDTLIFWSGVLLFLNDLFKYINKVWDIVLVKIRKGWLVDRDSVKDLFETLKNYFDIIF